MSVPFWLTKQSVTRMDLWSFLSTLVGIAVMTSYVLDYIDLPFVLVTLLCGLCASFGAVLFILILRPFKNNPGVAVVLTLSMQAIIPILFYTMGSPTALSFFIVLSFYMYWSVLKVSIKLRKTLPSEVIVE